MNVKNKTLRVQNQDGVPSLALFSLGSFDATLNERPISHQFRTDKERGLLAYLIWESHRPHRREILGELFWPDREEGVARVNLRQALHGIRRAICIGDDPCPFFQNTNEFVHLEPASQVWLDAAVFTEHIKFVHSHPHRLAEDCPVCAQHLRAAVELYQGDFLGTVIVESQAFQEWTVFKRETIFRDLLSALQTLASYYERKGDFETARKYVLKHLSLYPLEEVAHRKLMRLLVLSGQRAAALAQYQTCKNLLAEELGVAPAPKTESLYEQIRQGTLEAELELPEVFSLAGLDEVSKLSPNNLPTPLTSFIGREEEIEQISRCLGNPVCRLITLIGPPGAGKTRLAVHLAQQNLDKFPDGIWFIPTETIQRGDELVPAIAKVVGFSGDGLPGYTGLFRYLQTKKMLIILDNFEHLKQSGGPLLTLLGQAPEVKILVTSRERLNYQVACIFEIGGLTYPVPAEEAEGGDFPAVRLFLNRALHRPGQVSLPEKDMKAVITICQLLEGMPLAVELAAANAQKYSYAQIAEEIQRNLEVLKTSMLDVQERHRSMHAAINQSWNTLSDEEQRTFARLSIFRESFSFDAANHITETQAPVLTSLMDKSLVVMGETRRYKLPLILRNFAAEKLQHYGAPNHLFEKHSQFYMAFLYERKAELIQQTSLAPSREIEQELENIRMAWEWMTKQRNFEGIGQGLETLWAFYNFRDALKEGENAFRMCVNALEPFTDNPETGRWLSKALGGLAWFLSRQGEYEAARKYYQQSIACFAVHHIYEALVFPYFGSGFVAYQFGEYAQAQASFRESVHAGEKAGEVVWANMAKLYLVILEFAAGQNPHPEKDLLEILLAFEQTNNLQGQMRTLKQMGDVAHVQGNFIQAKNFYERTLKLAQNIEQLGIEAPLQMKLGMIASEEGEIPLAKHLLTSCLNTFEHIGDRKNIALVLGELGNIAAFENRVQEAHHLFRQALEIAASTFQPPIILDVLSGISCLLARAQRQENAWELLGLVQTHPATHPLTLRRVNRFLNTCQAPPPRHKMGGSPGPGSEPRFG